MKPAEIPIIEHGGTVHYSGEFRVFLMGQPFEARVRIVREIEYRARRYRTIDRDRVNRNIVACGCGTTN